MTLSTGSRLGPYEILAPLGAGGMGEVWKARDTRLERWVAVKVLPQRALSSEELKRRFEREAKAVAQLSHPHICALYDVGREGDVDFLVMEYLEGETLADRLAKGPLPLAQTLRYGTEIADALGKAHRQGIVHRDLKPGNVMLTKSGVKLLDFGLARVIDPAGPATGLSGLQTQDRALTAEGTILGTLQYMAPEQLEGKDTDARTDIFALGATLYEMVTGRKAFSGGSQASLISSIMQNDPPPISTAQPMSPPSLDRLVRTCLAKDPDDRWQSAADVGKQLASIADTSEPLAAGAVPGRPRRASGWLAASVLGVLLLLAVGFAAFFPRGRTSALPVIHSAILPPEGVELVSTEIFAGPVEISPDGSRVVFTAHAGEEPNLLWVKTLSDVGPARPLAGTDGAERPFWSPDGRFIGFFGSRYLRKVSVDGGPVFKLAPVTEGRGGSWNQNGVILFTPSARGPIYRVSAEGGNVEQETVLAAGDITHRYAHFLPDGRHFLYLDRRSAIGTSQPESAVVAGRLGSKETKTIASVNSNAVFASGRLLYVRERALVAQAFDPDRLAVSGEPVTIVPDVRMDQRFSRGVFSASTNGLLAYQTGKSHALSALRWIDRKGAVLGTVGDPAEFFDGGAPNISPDGRHATTALVDVRTGAADVWLVDLASGTRSRFTSGPGDKYFSAWSPDGRFVAHNMRNPHGGGYDVHLKPVGGSGADERVLTDENEWEVPTGFSPDGRFLLVQKRKGDRDDLFVLPLAGDRTLKTLVATPALETMGQFSPNGRYVAYVSDESGREEIYVTPFPGPGRTWQVSQNGGTEPRWRGDGKELFFFGPDNRLVAAEVQTDGETFEIGSSSPLFRARLMGVGFRYDVSKDGQRFLVNTGIPDELSPIWLLTNWTEKLDKVRKE